MKKSCFSIWLIGIVAATEIFGAEITWVATNQNNDMNTPSNWSSDSIPSSSDDAIFNIDQDDVSLTPTEQDASFSVSTINFPYTASVFHLNFLNQTLTLNGAGITGTQTNATIDATNTNNTSLLPTQIYFSYGSPISMGSAVINITNTASLSGSGSGQGLGVLTQYQMLSNGAFTIGTGGSVTLLNQGEDTTSGGGSNTVAFVSNSQLAFAESLTVQDTVAISVTNSGTFNGSSTSEDQVAVLVGALFSVGDNFLGGNSFNLTLSNSGSNTNSGAGGNYVASSDNEGTAQAQFSGNFTVGNNSTISLFSTGNNSGNSGSIQTVSYFWEGQFYTEENFQAGDNLQITVSNIGTDSSIGHGGHYVAFLESEDGRGNQLQIGGTTIVGSGANFTCRNSGTYTGTNSVLGPGVGQLAGWQCFFTDAFQAADTFQLNVANIGLDSAQGVGNDSIGNVSGSQAFFGATCTLGDQAAMTLSNEGTCSSVNSTLFNYAGALGNEQLVITDAFSAGNEFSLQVANQGTQTGSESSFGEDYVGYIGGTNQVILNGSCTVGSNATFNVTNSGQNSSNTANGTHVGYLIRGGQLNVQEFFQAGNDLTVTIDNSGTDSSLGSGNNYVGASLVDSQLLIVGACTVQNNAVMTLSNSGTSSGASTGNNLIGVVQDQMTQGTGPSSSFIAGNGYTLNVTNTGVSTSSGPGGNAIGQIADGSQATFNGFFTSQNDTVITISNSGTSSGTIASSNTVGFVQSSQFHQVYQLNAQDHFSLTVTNSGTNSNHISGYNSVIGVVETDSQIRVDSPFVIGNYGTITVSNYGMNNGSAVGGGSYVGTVEDFQAHLSGGLTAGNHFVFNATNTGIDNGTSSASDQVGSILSSSQLSTDAAISVGDYASFTLVNSGVNDTTSSGDNQIAYLGGYQLVVATGNFAAGNYLTISASNTGSDSSNGSGSNYTGYLSSSQVGCSGTFGVGDDATITLTNTGTNTSSTIGNFVGSMGGSQFSVAGAFSAGKNLTISATTTGTNTGDTGNIVGVVGGSQLLFDNTFTVDDGAVLTATNKATVSGSQIVFNNGFTITGSATIQALNQGTLTGNGILINGTNLGGNANLILQNSSLNVTATGANFTIGSLTGNSGCTAQSNTPLIFNTDSTVNATFAGVVQDFSMMVPTQLMKTGLGTQKLSGTNTYTGLTTVEEGTLIATGAVPGSVTVQSAGTFGGTGPIGGNLVNAGTIAPGQSIGTMHVTGTFMNNGGNYDLEVSSGGQTDLIDVTGAATITRGTVYVSSPDAQYTFQVPYTILTAGSLTGNYAQLVLPPSLNGSLSSDADHIYLTLVTAFTQVANSHNQFAVATQLDGIVSPDPNQSLLMGQLASLPISGSQAGLEALSGYQHTDDVWTSQVINRQFIRRLYDPIRSIVTQNGDPCDCCPEDNWTFWAEGGGGYSNLVGDRNAEGLHMVSWEGTAGIQRTFCCDWTAGIGAAYQHNRLHYQEGGSGSSNTWLLGLYGLYRPEYAYGFIDLTYGQSFEEIHRAIDVGSLHYVSKSKPKVSEGTIYAEVGGDLYEGIAVIQPFFGLDFSGFSRNGIKEHQPEGWGLSIHHKGWTSTTSRLGMHITMNHLTEATDVSLSLDLAWNRLLSCHNNSIRGEFLEFGDSYTIKGIDLDRNSVDYAFTLSIRFTEELNTYFEFSGESWHHMTTSNGICGLAYTW